MRKGARLARIGIAPSRITWVAWDRQRRTVRAVLRRWEEPAVPWEGAEERRYARLLLETGAVLEVYQEGEQWVVCGVED